MNIKQIKEKKKKKTNKARLCVEARPHSLSPLGGKVGVKWPQLYPSPALLFMLLHMENQINNIIKFNFLFSNRLYVSCAYVINIILDIMISVWIKNLIVNFVRLHMPLCSLVFGGRETKFDDFNQDIRFNCTNYKCFWSAEIEDIYFSDVKEGNYKKIHDWMVYSIP